MRYQATIAVRVWADSVEEAEKQIDGIVLGLPNSFQISIESLPHGSEISLIEEDKPDVPV